MPLAMFFRRIVLPAFGGDTIRPRWPRPIGATRSMIRVVRLSGVVSSFICSFGKIGGQVFEVGAALGDFGVEAVDRFDPQQAVVLLAVLGRADWPVT